MGTLKRFEFYSCGALSSCVYATDIFAAAAIQRRNYSEHQARIRRIGSYEAARRAMPRKGICWLNGQAVLGVYADCVRVIDDIAAEAGVDYDRYTFVSDAPVQIANPPSAESVNGIRELVCQSNVPHASHVSSPVERSSHTVLTFNNTTATQHVWIAERPRMPAPVGASAAAGDA